MAPKKPHKPGRPKGKPKPKAAEPAAAPRKPEDAKGSSKRTRNKPPFAPSPPPQPGPTSPPADAAAAALRSSYERRKEKERRRQASMAESGRDIGELPAVVDPARRERCRMNLEEFATTYFPHKFYLGFSDDLRESVETLKRAILDGGLFALAVPRGGGKSTIGEVGELWAALYGHRRFIMGIGASKPLAVQSLENIQAELLVNEELFQDFPEVIHPIRSLENIANRSAGQLYQGKPTYIKWKRDRVVFATIEGSPSSGCIIRASGLTGGLRGLNEKGKRPDFAVVDDWQTDSSAKSHSQTRIRLGLINGAVRGLAGPGKTMAVYSPVTVIAPGDGADQLLDVQQFPEWQGRRYELLKQFPTNLELWNQYNEIRKACLRNGDLRIASARAFYRKHRKEMDAGGVVAWEARKYPDDVSALEHAMGLFFANPIKFFAEYQNRPKVEDESTAGELKAHEVAKRLNGLKRGVVPLSATRLTGYVDVQHSLLYWVVVAWSDDFSGDVIDYGTFPDQGRPYFTLREARHTLQAAAPKATTAAAVDDGLRKLTAKLVGTAYPREGTDAGTGRVELVPVDWSDGNLQDVIARVCRTSPVAALLIPSEGKGIGPADRPMYAYQQRPGERLGTHWLLFRAQKQQTRAVRIDSNYWKSHVADGLLAPLANPGAIRFYGTPGTDHELFADHCVAETRAKLRNEKTGRAVDVWRLKTNKPDNHFFDCLSGAAVAASIRGCTFTPRPTAAPPGNQAPRPPQARPAGRDRVRPLF